MAAMIIDSIRKRTDLRGSLFLCALELAHQAMDETGVAKMDFQKLADKMHMSVSTAKRRVKQLLELGIIGKLPNPLQKMIEGGKILWRRGKNQYQFLIPFKRPPARLFKRFNAFFFRPLLSKMTMDLPKPTPPFNKTLALRDELRNQEKALRILGLSPESDVYKRLQEEIARLRALLAAREAHG